MGKWKRDYSKRRRWAVNHLLKKYGSVCYICHKPFERRKDITIDHWIPVSKGGLDTIDNYRLAHDQCNQEKKDMLPDEFLALQNANE